MNTINLQIHYVDGTAVEVSTTAADFIAFEMKFDKSIAALGTDVRLTYLFFLAWTSLHRTKVTELSFEDWSATVSMVSEFSPKGSKA